jgi:hypothetical protein
MLYCFCIVEVDFYKRNSTLEQELGYKGLITIG